MKILFSLLIALTLTAPLPTRAQTYEPGTIGYLYEQCQSAIQLSSQEEYENSWCGRFASGYSNGFLGALLAAGQFGDSYPSPDTPCAKEIKAEFFENGQKIFCQYGEGANLLPGIMVFFDWAMWLRASDAKTLNQPTLPYINDAVRPGPYCQHVNIIMDTNKTIIVDNFRPNPKLQIPSTWLSDVRDFLTEKEYRQCLADIEASDDPQRFIKTGCGAMITGILSALYFPQHLLKGRKPAEERCSAGINARYDEMDLPARLCLGENPDPLAFAHKILDGRTYDPVEEKLVPDIDDSFFCSTN